MRTPSQIIRIFLWTLLGFGLAFTSLALSRPFPQAQDNPATPEALTATLATTARSRSEAGSTDEIVLIAVIIVLIVILPILIRRKDWENGKQPTK